MIPPETCLRQVPLRGYPGFAFLLLFLFLFARVASAQRVATTLNTITGPPGWYLLSLPFESIHSISAGEMKVFEFSGGSYTEAPVRNPAYFRAGTAYWLYSPAPLSLKVDGEPSTKPVHMISLTRGWNLFGNPYNIKVKWSEVLVSHEGGRFTVPEAEKRGFIYGCIFGYDPSQRAYHVVTPGDKLEPWKGYWIYSTARCFLVVSNPAPVVAAPRIQVESEPKIVPADGKTPARLKILVKDSSGKPVAKELVSVSTTLGNLSGEKTVTDGNGEAFVLIRSTKEGSAQVTVKMERVCGSASVAFTAPPPDALTGVGLKFTDMKEITETINGAIGALLLDDGRIRLYYDDAKKGGIRSAVTSDGVTFQVDEGARLQGSKTDKDSIIGSPSLIRLDDGRIRMYYQGQYYD